jgi:hypothetical protein
MAGTGTFVFVGGQIARLCRNSFFPIAGYGLRW